MKNILINKKCFITGVTGAVGLELARLFAKNKCKIIYHRKKSFKANKKDIKNLNLNFPKKKFSLNNVTLFLLMK